MWGLASWPACRLPSRFGPPAEVEGALRPTLVGRVGFRRRLVRFGIVAAGIQGGEVGVSRWDGADVLGAAEAASQRPSDGPLGADRGHGSSSEVSSRQPAAGYQVGD